MGPGFGWESTEEYHAPRVKTLTVQVRNPGKTSVGDIAEGQRTGYIDFVTGCGVGRGVSSRARQWGVGDRGRCGARARCTAPIPIRLFTVIFGGYFRDTEPADRRWE